MKIFRLAKKQKLPIDKSTAWNFLSDPKNLKIITPESMGFNILSGAERTMYEGQIIQYKVNPFKGITTTWVTEITHVVEQNYFVDEQRFGPYAFWHHKHFINEINGGVEMEDIIDYKLPFGFLGQMVQPFIVKPKLEQIFEYRANQLEKIFGKY
jgi:ligand-binding SRPBCC domain-containing protein